MGKILLQEFLKVFHVLAGSFKLTFIIDVLLMSRVCQLTGVRVLVGNNVSHSKRKTRRVFLPNLQNKRFLSYVLNSFVSFRVTPCAMKTVDLKGGIDEFLLHTKDNKLSKKALKIKK